MKKGEKRRAGARQEKGWKWRGFTIIEVVLVLGIAGLIFLMVFIVLPTLQRSQRDADRREAVTTLLNAVKDYQSNNRGALPTGTGTIKYDKGATKEASWAGLYANYLGADFIDPDGTAYQLKVVSCKSTNNREGEECTNGQISSDTAFPNNYTMLVVVEGTCKDDKTVKTGNPRKLAVVYRLEGGGVYCSNS